MEDHIGYVMLTLVIVLMIAPAAGIVAAIYPMSAFRGGIAERLTQRHRGKEVGSSLCLCVRHEGQGLMDRRTQCTLLAPLDADPDEQEVHLSERGPGFPITTLYRPVGQKELELIELSGWTAFPPRLAHQPIFYPVVSEEYAAQIARDWNTKDPASGYVGYVTRFNVDREYLDRYPVQRAGSNEHLEHWIPAEDLDEFNRHIIGRIEVVAEFRPEPRAP